MDDLETLLNDERYEFKDEAEKCKKELVYERRATVVLSLACKSRREGVIWISTGRKAGLPWVWCRPARASQLHDTSAES